MTHLYKLLQISQKLFDGKNDSKSVRNMWERYWAMFKVVRRHQNHTGGGDGDEPDDGTDVETGGDGGRKPKVLKRVHFSKSVLDTFEQSEFF